MIGWLEPLLDGAGVVQPWIAVLLIAVSFVTSLVAAVFGIGGGVALLAVMALVIPAKALIPVHGLVQIGSNAGRTLLLVRHVEWPVILPFALGSAVGAALGGMVAVRLPPWAIEAGLAAFIIWSAWGRLPTAFGRSTLAVTGAFSSFLTMFFGATGPFVAAVVRTLGFGRVAHIATHAMCMSVQHGLKLVTFGALGFAFGPYLPLALGMIASGFLGTLVGRQLLHRISERRFQLVLKLLLTALALRLLWGALARIG